MSNISNDIKIMYQYLNIITKSNKDASTPTRPSSILYLNSLVYDKYKYINTKITFNAKNNRLVGNSNKLNNVKINAVRVLIL